MVAQRVEQAKKAAKRQAILVKRKQDQKDAVGQQRTSSIKEQMDRQAAYRREAARLRAEEQKETRDQQAFLKQ